MSGFLSIFWTFMILSQTHPTAAESVAEALPAPIGVVDTLEADTDAFHSERSNVTVRFGDQEVLHETMAVFALPGERVPVEILGGEATARVEASAGSLVTTAPGRFEWTAPATPGDAEILVFARDGSAPVTLNAFVMVPYSEMRNGKVRGYRVGAYPAPRAGKAHERRPRGFVEVTAANADRLVAPHFRLAQFVCKSGEGYPKYVVLRAPLLVRLESLLAELHESGVEAKTFQVMSAYRTPHYNKAIGNTTSFTRHQYGDAADIFVDDDGDGRMDDLNRDGRHDKKDALVLHELAERTEGKPDAGGLVGGLSAYAPNHAHGAFVHVDTRGYPARW